jgi:membrane-associated phospholipid phosphatase
MHSAQRLIDKGQGTVNLVAAIPSLHAAYAAMIAVFFWPLIRRRWLRPLLLIHPALMLFTIVYGGEHYAVDALVGYAVVAVACGGWSWSERRRAEPTTVTVWTALPVDSGENENRHPNGRPVVDEVGILGG